MQTAKLRISCLFFQTSQHKNKKRKPDTNIKRLSQDTEKGSREEERSTKMEYQLIADKHR